ncbi:alternative NADH-dehydrogenase [Purpureocillium lavendulum]|uniref:Alternative NADH-dehydrogenase n=1 Tax=Purpureocillium lavendulum TaxID=1247861 RepID=A0AB34FP99_9HYPO|nr:alternative NADH-dehydrogenase [Purpureocillium lavendulum]
MDFGPSADIPDALVVDAVFSSYSLLTMAARTVPSPPARPTSRHSFEIAIVCALTLEADAVDALFDVHWDDDGSTFDKPPGDPNAYSIGAIGRHNVVLAHMPGMGKVNAAIVATNCRASFPNIRLAIVVGICGIVPLGPHKEEIILGDVVISDGVVEYDLCRRLAGSINPKDILSNSLRRPDVAIRTAMTELKSSQCRTQLSMDMANHLDNLRSEPLLGAVYPGVEHDRLFDATYQHASDGKEPGEQLGCDGTLIPRERLRADGGQAPQPAVHFGLVASGDSVMKSGEHRDAIAAKDGIIAFEMEGAGAWDVFPCVVIKGARLYEGISQSLGAFIVYRMPAGPFFLVPYPQNEAFIGRDEILTKLKIRLSPSPSRPRISLFGLGGIGKTQIAIAYTYWLHEKFPEASLFWVHGSSAQRFRQAYASIAQDCHVPGCDNPNADVLTLVKSWLERLTHPWLLVVDSADDRRVFYTTRDAGNESDGDNTTQDGGFARFLPESSHGSVLITTRNKQVGVLLIKNRDVVEVGRMEEHEAESLVHTSLDGIEVNTDEVRRLTSQLEFLPLALVQAAAYIRMNSMELSSYLHLIEKSDQNLLDLLSKEFDPIGRDSVAPHAVAATWMRSLKQIEGQSAKAAQCLFLLCSFERESISVRRLSQLCKSPQGEATVDAGQEDFAGDVQIEEALGLLKAYSFISAEKDGSVMVHRLVHLIARKWLREEDTSSRVARQVRRCLEGRQQDLPGPAQRNTISILAAGNKTANNDDMTYDEVNESTGYTASVPLVTD